MDFIYSRDCHAEEVFKLENIKENDFIMSHITSKLIAFSDLILSGRVFDMYAELRIGGKTIMTGEEPVHEDYRIFDLIKTLDKASDEEADLFLKTGYEYKTGDYTFTALASPEYSADFFEKLTEENSMDHAFYLSHIEDTGYETDGEITAYGTLNGKKYNGIIDFREVSKLPPCHCWTALCTELCFELESCYLSDFTPEEINQLMNCCIALGRHSMDNYDLELEDDYFWFALNNLVLEGEEDLEDFLALVKRLAKLTKGHFSSKAELLEIKDEFRSIIRLTFDSYGDYKIEVAGV